MDVHAASPASHVSLSRVGLTGVETIIRLGLGERSPQAFLARLECFLELEPTRRSADAPRFEELIADALRDVVVGATAMQVEQLAGEIAQRLGERRHVRRAEV